MRAAWLVAVSACSAPVQIETVAPFDPTLDEIDLQLAYAAQQIDKAEARLDVTAQPRFTLFDHRGGQWGTSTTQDWRSGFFTGSEWLMVEAFGTDSHWRATAAARTAEFADEIARPQSHDVGFKTVATYGNGYRLTGDADYRAAVLVGADTLAARFMPEYGITRSWDEILDGPDVRVIIDNMMNLEVLFLAAELTSSPADRDRWLDIAVQHAVTTEAHHVRDSADPLVDGSTCHVYFYNLGECHTHQGLSDGSTWSRGQAWAMYGFTMSHRYARRYPRLATPAALFLATAQRTSDTYLRRLAEPRHGDWVPLHDFDQVDPAAPKDSSAAAIAAAALIELSRVPEVDAERRAAYRRAAEATLDDLLDPAGPYRTSSSPSDPDEEAILVGATTSYTTAGAGNREVERALVYADYYVIEALLRYRDATGAQRASAR